MATSDTKKSLAAAVNQLAKPVGSSYQPVGINYQPVGSNYQPTSADTVKPTYPTKADSLAASARLLLRQTNQLLTPVAIAGNLIMEDVGSALDIMSLIGDGAYATTRGYIVNHLLNNTSTVTNYKSPEYGNRRIKRPALIKV